MRDLEVIFRDYCTVPERDIPDGDATAGVTYEEASSIAELETIRMHLVEDGTFRRSELFLVLTCIRDLHPWSQD